jgi:hypothetical protein
MRTLCTTFNFEASLESKPEKQVFDVPVVQDPILLCLAFPPLLSCSRTYSFKSNAFSSRIDPQCPGHMAGALNPYLIFSSLVSLLLFKFWTTCKLVNAFYLLKNRCFSFTDEIKHTTSKGIQDK